MTLRRTVATPRALPPLARQASAIARLSAPWQVACTMTLRAKPRWSRSAKSCALLGVAGGVLALGRVGELRARAEHVAVRVHRARRRRELRLARARAPVEPAGRLLEASASASASFAVFEVIEDPVGLDAPVRAAARTSCGARLPNSPASARSAIQAWRSAVPAALQGSRPASRTVTAASRISSARRRPCSMTRWKK